MSERFSFVPPEERERRPLPKTHDFRYAYRGYYEDGGICRVRLFQDAVQPPIILVTQLAENRNTSITNMCEYLAAEIGAKHVPHRFEEREPFRFIEHYPRETQEDKRWGVEYSRVTFDSYTPKLFMLHGVLRPRLGVPRWTHLPNRDVLRLIGPSVLDDEGSGEGR